MTSYEQIFENNRKWIDEKRATDRQIFERLAEGQNPDFLYIGCSDSRVVPELFMGLDPGELFVHRNIANLVSNSDPNLMSILEYAVNCLKVKHIIVCGHTGCQGVKAAMSSHDDYNLESWLSGVRKVYGLHKKELDSLSDNNKRDQRLIELNTIEQSKTVALMDQVTRSFKKTGFPTVHAWIFDIESGKLHDLTSSLT